MKYIFLNKHATYKGGRGRTPEQGTGQAGERSAEEAPGQKSSGDTGRRRKGMQAQQMHPGFWGKREWEEILYL